MIIKMYNCKYRRCCCQKSFDNNMLQDACNNCGVVADYYNENNKNSSCDCGFEESEIKVLNDFGFENCSLGKNILRAETAACYVLSAIEYQNHVEG